MSEETKKCSKCGEIKEVTAFYVKTKARTKDGRSVHCKKCADEYVKKWNEQNRERRRSIGSNSEKNAPASRKKEKAAGRVRRLTGSYVKAKIKRQFGLSIIDITEALVEAKREQLSLSRICRKANRTFKEVFK